MNMHDAYAVKITNIRPFRRSGRLPIYWLSFLCVLSLFLLVSTDLIRQINFMEWERRKAVAAAIQTESQIISSFLITDDRGKQEREKKTL